jgi:hypothetical protein
MSNCRGVGIRPGPSGVLVGYVMGWPAASVRDAHGERSSSHAHDDMDDEWGRRRLMVALLALGLALAAGIITAGWDIPGLGPTAAAAGQNPNGGDGHGSGADY